jgi:hypothetical protein
LGRLSDFIFQHLTSTIIHQPSYINHLPSNVIGQQKVFLTAKHAKKTLKGTQSFLIYRNFQTLYLVHKTLDNKKTSTVIHQPSTIIHQPSYINYHTSTIIHQPSSIKRHWTTKSLFNRKARKENPQRDAKFLTYLNFQTLYLVHKTLDKKKHQPSYINRHTSTIIHQPSYINHHT